MAVWAVCHIVLWLLALLLLNLAVTTLPVVIEMVVVKTLVLQTAAGLDRLVTGSYCTISFGTECVCQFGSFFGFLYCSLYSTLFPSLTLSLPLLKWAFWHAFPTKLRK